METSVCQSGTDYFLSSTEKHIDGTSGSVIVVPTECACVCQQKSLQFFNIFFFPPDLSEWRRMFTACNRSRPTPRGMPEHCEPSALAAASLGRISSLRRGCWKIWLVQKGYGENRGGGALNG